MGGAGMLKVMGNFVCEEDWCRAVKEEGFI